MNLNTNQKLAIQCINRPCLVLAGAGSGKTKVITEKILYLINSCNYGDRSIVALTFTNKAANEMKHRVQQKICRTTHCSIYTFHSFGMNIIQHSLHLLDFRPNFFIIDEYDQIHILQKIVQKHAQYDLSTLKKILKFISMLKNNLLNYSDASKLQEYQNKIEWLKYYYLYESFLIHSNFLDFDDLIFIPIKLFQKHKNVRVLWKKKIKYLLVDEYQDTNNIQYIFMKQIIHSNNFTLVGDDDQSIYSWRGANPQNMNLLKNDFPTLQVIKLEENYRSSGRILNIANTLISHNPHIFHKKLFSNMHYGPMVKVIATQDEYEEVKRVVREILIHRNKFKTSYQDYAILYRSNNQSKILEKYLVKKNIPYQIFGKKSILDQNFVKILIYYLKVIINPDDDFSFLKIINIPNRRIGNKTTTILRTISLKKNVSLYKIGMYIDSNTKITMKIRNKIKNLCLLIQDLQNFASVKPNNILKKIIDDIEYIQFLKKTVKNQIQFNEYIKNIGLLLNSMENIKVYDNKKENFSALSNFISQIVINSSEFSEKNIKQIDQDQIFLMTLHASKGLEFSFVFIIGMEEGILPHYISIKNKDCLEERRLTYVGITRARKELTFTYTRKRMLYGNNISMNPSRFLDELPQKDLLWLNKKNISSFFQNSKIHIKTIKKMLKLKD
ncbi:UvrD-helicase domain-containing protein [Buchnera aphidicola]|nr:UvrD-helicase domain-containing protein [Buchnera aphidicola]